MSGPAWVEALEPGAPNAVAAWRGIEEGATLAVRREVRRRAGPGSAGAIVGELAVLAEAMIAALDTLSVADLARPGGEGDWNVAQTLGHVSESRAGLALAAARAAAGTFPVDAPVVVQGIPGAADADHDALRRRLAQSQRIVERAGRTVDGHESDPCPLQHPQVGRLRCGEWLLFAAVHDLMHLEQLHALAGPVRMAP